jgi:hypothetical protein
MIENGGQSQYQ